MNVYTLRDRYYQNNPDGHFFDHDTLKFFGETMSSMRVLTKTDKIRGYDGTVHECYCFSTLQRKYPGGARRAYHWFDINTYDEIIPDNTK